MLTSTIALLRERGTGGVSIDAVLAHSGAPRGSVYHHFPGGRNELIISAVRQAGDFISTLIDTASVGSDPRAAFARFVQFWKQLLEDSDYQAGCPVAAVAVDQREDLPEAGAVVGEIFASWHDKIRDLLTGYGIPAARAQRLATLSVATIEGAVILCRAQRSSSPLDEVLEELGALFPVLDRSAG